MTSTARRARRRNGDHLDRPSRLARWAFAVVFLAATVFIVASGVSSSGTPGVTTVVTEKQVAVLSSPGASPPTSTTTERSTQTTTTGPSLLDRVASPAVVFMVQLGFALLAAVVAAAALQRVMLGEYAFSLGPLTIPAVSRADVERPGEAAIEALTRSGVVEQEGAGVKVEPSYFPPGAEDPSLQLVALRIEIEQRLHMMARAAGLEVPTRMSARQLLRMLADAGHIPDSVGAQLWDLIELGNRAAHGVEVSADAGEWAREEGPRLIQALDALYEHVRNG